MVKHPVSESGGPTSDFGWLLDREIRSESWSNMQPLVAMDPTAYLEGCQLSDAEIWAWIPARRATGETITRLEGSSPCHQGPLASRVPRSPSGPKKTRPSQTDYMQSLAAMVPTPSVHII